MRIINVNSIVIRNFRSFISDDVLFPASTGLKYLGGQNLVDVRLGANAAGKTSFWDAFAWCSYGKGIKGTRASGVLNWDGAKNVEVVIEFTVADLAIEGDIKHVLRRLAPPERIFLDDVRVEQESVDKFLGLTYEMFLHSVIFGQGEPLFPDLPVPKRADLLDEVLDLNLWTRCVDATTKKLTALGSELEKFKVSEAKLQGQLEQIPTDEMIQKEINGWEMERDFDISNLEAESDRWEQAQEEQLQQMRFKSLSWEAERRKAGERLVAELQRLELDHSKVTENIRLCQLKPQTNGDPGISRNFKDELISLQQQYYDLVSKQHETISKLEFWRGRSLDCPTCGQEVVESTRPTRITALMAEDDKLSKQIFARKNEVDDKEAEVQQLRLQAEERRVAVARAVAEERGFSRELQRINQQMNEVEGQAAQILQELELNSNPFLYHMEQIKRGVNPTIAQREQLLGKPNPFLDKLAVVKSERDVIDSQLTTVLTESKKIEAGMLALEFWKTGFKRLRLYFVEKILAMLQIETGSAASGLGLVGWGAGMATETETKSGTVKLGVRITIKSPKHEGPWESWSGGETQRLRLAIAEGLASVIQRARGVFWNIEVLDEPTSWLSSEGIEDLLEALRYRADVLGKQIWIVDHRALNFSGFSGIYTVIKDANGSRMLKVSEAVN
jgi:hypothetical protein